MTLKIERISGKRRTRIRLSGELRSEHLDQLKAEIERGGPRVELDLQELDLVDVESVRFLNGARWRVSPCFAARLISGNGCSGSEGLSKAPTHKRNRGMAGWRKKMGSRYGEDITSGNEYQRRQFTGLQQRAKKFRRSTRCTRKRSS